MKGDLVVGRLVYTGPDLYHLVITVDNPTEANVLKAEQEVLEGIEVHVPVVEDVSDPRTLKLVNIDEIEPEKQPTYYGKYRTVTENDINKLGQQAADIIDEAIFQAIKEKPPRAMIVQSPNDKHPHHSLLGKVAITQRNYPTNIFTSAHEAFGERLHLDKCSYLVEVYNRDAIMNLAELQTQSETKWNEDVPYEKIEKSIKEYIDRFRKIFQEMGANWDRVAGKLGEFEEGKGKKGYHSLAGKIKERQTWRNIYQGRKVDEISRTLMEIVYPLEPVDHSLLSKDAPIIYSAMHQDDRNISLWSYGRF